MAVLQGDRVRVFDRASMRRLDARCIDQYGIPGILLMENAAAGAAAVVTELTTPQDTITIVCGPGNNGGDGWAMARHLCNAGRTITILQAAAPRAGSDAATNEAIARQMGLHITGDAHEIDRADFIVDALLGTGLDRDVVGEMKRLIEGINDSPAPVLAVDLPSGLDADRGVPLGEAVHAAATATLAGWKLAFEQPGAQRFTGTITTIDIGAPRVLHDSLGKPRRA